MRLGVLGGTFNPVHNAHIQMALLAKKALSLDEVLIMVAADPPHKRVDGHVPAETRFRMAEMAAEGIEGVTPSDLELRRKGKSYTVDTLETLKKLYPDAEITLIIGSDTMQDFMTWHRPKDIVSLCELACVPRKGLTNADKVAAAALRRDLGAKLTMLPSGADAISSTLVRESVTNAKPIGGFVCAKVEWHIYENALYFPPELSALEARCRELLTEKRFEHTVGTMIESVRLAALWGADGRKARLAALLHDCAKNMDKARLAILSGDDSGIAAVQHAFAGAVAARDELGVSDADVLRAVRLHCTGERNMTTLEKIVYLADITEPTRDFEGVESYRKALKKGENEAMLYALTQTKKRLAANHEDFHPASQRALDYFQNMKEENH